MYVRENCERSGAHRMAWRWRWRALGFRDVGMKNFRVWGSWQGKEGENGGSTWLVVMGPCHELEGSWNFRIALYKCLKLRGILIIGG